VKKRETWRPIFDASNSWVATAVQRTTGVVEVLIGRRSVGVVGDMAAARHLVERVNGGESPDEGGKA
jgi:hypothetical protein